jgi:hypothetical protein
MRRPTPEDLDHRRDLAKHDWRPGDPPEHHDAAGQADYEAAVARFVLGEDDAPALVATLVRLEMDHREAERAAYAAEADHYGSGK